MLLTLLPLAGWAQDIAVTIQIGTDAAAASLTKDYQGSAYAITKIYAGDDDITANADYTKKWYKGSNEVLAADLKNAGTYTLKVTKAGSTFADATLTINKINLVVTAKNAGMTYGDPTPAVSEFYTAAGWVGGEDAATVGHPVSLPASLETTAGTHAFLLTPNEMTNYTVSFAAAGAGCELAVAKKLLVVKTDVFPAINYGGTIPFFTANVTGFVNDETVEVLGGTLAFTAQKGTEDPFPVAQLKNAGTYQIIPAGYTSDNYNFDFQSTAFTINKKALAATMIANIADAEYNGLDQKPTAANGKLSVTDGTNTIAVTTDYTVSYKKGDAALGAEGAVAAADDYKVIITAADGNYSGSAEKTFKITKKTLYIKTKSYEKVYDGEDYTPSVANNITTVGLVGEETLAGVLGTNELTLLVGGEAKQKNFGEYTITVTGSAADDEMFNNYTPSYGNIGKLNITKKTVTITANDQSKTFGAEHALDAAAGVQTDAVEPSATNAKYYTKWVTVTGLVGDDALTTYPKVTRAAGEDNGTYDINATGAAAGDNYTINYVKGTFTIGKASVTIWAEDKTSVFGQPKVALTAIIDGMTDEDAATVQAKVNDALAIDEEDATNVGTYTIVVGDIDIAANASVWANYNATITKVPANYVITKAPLKIEAIKQAKHVGDVVTAEASDATIKINTEGVSDDDKALLFETITLAFSNEAPQVPTANQDDDILLAEGAATGGHNGTTATTDGIWVNGIKIIVGDYNALPNANYTLTGTGAETKAGTLYVTAENASITLPRVAKADFSNNTKNTAAATIAANDGKLLTVKLGESLDYLAEKWYSIVLPFDTDVKSVSAAFGYAVVDVFDKENSNGTDVRFKLHMQELPANEPFLVKIYKKKNNNTVEFEDVVIKNSAAPEIADAYGNKFVGTYAGKNGGFNSANDYVFGFGADKTSYDPAGANFYVRPLGAWVSFKDAQSASAPHMIYIEEPDGTATSINVATRESIAKNAEGWYNLNGMKLNAAPTEKGVYIQNGKKVVIK